MNEPPGARARVGLSGLTVAEYFRDEEGRIKINIYLIKVRMSFFSSIIYLDLLKLVQKYLLFLDVFHLL